MASRTWRRSSRSRTEGFAAPARAIVKGDLTEPAISAASILAKTHRDAQMKAYCAAHPGYGFSQHKGYGTEEHREAILKHGRCPAHRDAFLRKLFARPRDLAGQMTLFAEGAGG